MKKNNIVQKLVISLFCCIITVSLIVPRKLKAEVAYTDICDMILKKQSVFLDPDLLQDALEGDVWGILQDIYNNTMSYKTWKDTTHACEVDPDSVHGGHGGKVPNKVWYTVLNDTENDQKNGNNYNYYTNSNYSTTNNYSVTNSTTNNISYTYENTAYNYYYDVNNSYYNIENNTYNYYLSTNNYLTVVNNYNNTTIIDNGSNRVLYYRLPDGSNSLNMTEEIALNGYKTSLSVKSYENTYDSDDLVALYHFDGNELDSAYPTQTNLNFTRNSIQYIGSSTPFNESLALYGQSDISVNKYGKFTSLRFNPIFNENWSLSINGTDLGSAELNFDTITHYDEYNGNYYVPSGNGTYYYHVYYNSSSDLYYCDGYSKDYLFSNIDSLIEFNNNDIPNHLMLNFSLNDFVELSGSITTYSNTYYLDDLTSSDLTNPFVYDYVYNNQYYQIQAINEQRSYNYVNQFYIESDPGIELVNFNMWNYLTINIDGSVYINGNDTGIDVDNTQNLSISIDGDSVTYIDELALFNSNHNNYSPFYPYSSNIVYSVPEYYEYKEVKGIKTNEILINNNFINDNYWISNNSYRTRINVIDNKLYTYYNFSSSLNLFDYGVKQENNNAIVQNHIYYICFNIYSSINNNFKFGSFGNTNEFYVENNNLTFYSLKFNNNSNLKNLLIYPNTNVIVDEYFYIQNINLVDLTLMFGSGYEPSKEWCDQNLTDYIAYNVNPDVTESPYNIDSGYTYLKQIPTGLAKNNEILIQSIIPVNNWKIGGYRSSNPSNGDVFCNVDDLGYITSVQQYNGLDWVEVTAGLYNEYMGMWISALGFNIFNQNWEYTEYKYLNDGGSNNMLIRFFSDRFNDLKSWIDNIKVNSIFNVNNEFINDQETVINNSNEVTNISNNIQEIENNIFNQFDLAAENVELKPLESFGNEFNLSSGWVKEQFDNFIYYEAEEGETERELNPIGYLLLFSLSMGLVLLVIGKKA